MQNLDVMVCIGNTDNKLTQQAWADYVQRVDDELKKYEVERHFFGGSESFARWQNAAWLSIIPQEEMERFRQKLTHIRKDYHQDAAYVLIGDAQFV